MVVIYTKNRYFHRKFNIAVFRSFAESKFLCQKFPRELNNQIKFGETLATMQNFEIENFFQKTRFFTYGTNLTKTLTFSNYKKI